MGSNVIVRSSYVRGPRRTIRHWLTLTALVGLILLFSQTTFAANPPPVQTFYVPLPEDQIFNALTSIFPGNSVCGYSSSIPNVQNPINTYVSIATIGDGTVVYYDHWEDGFEADISNPTQTTTEIWGDNNGSNGLPPGFSDDAINAGDIIVLDNQVDTNTLQSVTDFDGGDKFAASKTIAVTRAAWATGSSTLLAGAVEIYDTNNWGVDFEVPVGEDITSVSLFEYTSLVIMAAKNGTVVNIDADGNDTIETTVTLDEGESYHVNGGVNAGGKVNASTPVQVDLITGNYCASYESRWFTLFPTEQWSDSYYSPVGTPSDDSTSVFLHNPGSDPITIEWETVTGPQSSINLLAGATDRRDVPDNSGAHFYTIDGTLFMAIAAVDSDISSSTHDWGFALIPEGALTQQVLIGWGPGHDPLFTSSENSSPVWVTPVLADGDSGSVEVCVDFNGDGGPLTDPGGGGYDELLTLNTLVSQRVYDPDGDQTGMLLYVCDNSRAKIAAAWGQDPNTASPGNPAIDVGTTIPPLPTLVAGKDVEVVNDVDGDGQISPGDTILYTIVIQNISLVPILDVVMSDTVPLHTKYVVNSTRFDNGTTVTLIPDNGVTPFPLDEGGVNLGTLPAKDSFSITFQVTIDDFPPAGVDTIVNQAVIKTVDEELKPKVETVLNFEPAIELIKTAGTAPDGEVYYIQQTPSLVIYHYVITNIGDTYLSDIVITDDNGTPDNTSDDITLTSVECADLAGPLAPLTSVSCSVEVSISDDVTNLAQAVGNPTDQNGNDLPDLNEVKDEDDAIVKVEEATAITLISFTATGNVDSITLNWQIGTEINNAGFNIYRATSENGSYTRINDQFIAAKGDPLSGASYTYVDTDVREDVTYYYKLQDVEFDGDDEWHGPISATASSNQPDNLPLLPIRPVYLPLIVK
jgi:uncharacterized repeat protein (TIGR01451 family)